MTMPTPTTTISETALRAYDFAKANIKTPLLSIAPFVVVCQVLRIFDMPDDRFLTAIMTLPLKAIPLKILMLKAIALIGVIAGGYIYSVFAAHMHRAFINNTPAGPVNILRPSKDDWRFIGMFFVLFLISFGLSFAVIFVFAAAMPQAGPIVGLLAMLFLVPFIVRLMILLPDRAVGGTMTFKEALRVSDGLFWKICLSPLLAGWRLLLGAVVYIFVTVFVVELIIRSVFPAIADEENIIHKLILFLIQLPATVGIMYWVAAIVIAGLSNYYLLAKEKQNAI